MFFCLLQPSFLCFIATLFSEAYMSGTGVHRAVQKYSCALNIVSQLITTTNFNKTLLGFGAIAQQKLVHTSDLETFFNYFFPAIMAATTTI